MRCTALLLCLAAAGCATEPPIAPAPLPASEFEWVSSSGGIAGRTMTPASEGYAVRLVFDGDSVRGFRNGSLVAAAGYEAREEGGADVVVTYDAPLQVFEFAPLETHTVRSAGNDTWLFTEPCCDRFQHVFRSRMP